jgi:hypothetical protein
MQASLYADIPLYTFLLLHGASLERATEGGVTPLLLLCGWLSSDRMRGWLQ